ncbi:MAG: Lrp/AsnC ligand binding domain-containing protein [Prevotellaceae bacterium]|nr:Lrp/AsnC ligand binding domain-containing protein [Prevotellaceae bacterium]
MKRLLDNLDRKILDCISKNARMPLVEVAKACENVSGAAVHQRIQKMLSNGVLKGSEYMVDTDKVGYLTCAYVGIAISDMSQYNHIIVELEKNPHVVECHATTGRYVLLVKVYAKNNRHLGNLILDKISRIKGVSATETLQISLDELFRRQIMKFDDPYADNDENEESNF